MSPNFSSVLEAARQLSAEEQRQLAQELLHGVAEDPVFQLGKNPIDDEVTDASVNHDRYLYRPRT